MGWESGKAMAFIEYLMLCRLIVLRTEIIDRLTEPGRKAQSWWESGESPNDQKLNLRRWPSESR